MYKYHQEIVFLDNEYWWGGVVDHGVCMPYEEDYPLTDLNQSHYGNQVTSFFISSKGRYFYSNEPICYQIKNKVLIVDSLYPLTIHDQTKNLKEAYYDCVQRYFHLDHHTPLMDMFSLPQYNTWIEMNWKPTQEKVLKYAHSIIENGFQPGILMIDDGWQEDYGVWEFNARHFPNPKKMIEELHSLGFKVMLWLVPCVSPDSFIFRENESKGIFYKEKENNNVKIMNWWDGYSAVLDLTNPQAKQWLTEQCDYLQNEYGIDGFKFDGADDEFYPEGGRFYQDIARVHQSRLYSEFATKYSLNEMRACFNMQGKGLAQRLTDKKHSWNERGINTLIPNGIVMSLLGYIYCCPDMIGGGLVGDFIANNYQSIDQELFVRYAQVATFFPMMQFSLAPWVALSKENLAIVKKCCDLHLKLNQYIQQLVLKASQDGSPIIRSLAFEFPEDGYECVKDEFMLGDKYLVAPVVMKNTYHRKVILPKGRWLDDTNKEYLGNQIIEIDVPIERLPYFVKIDS